MLSSMAAVKTATPTDGDPVAGSPTRRERVHAQTRDEILRAAQALVADGEELTLRAVARAVGMTAPALYRYADSLDDLLDLLGGSLYDELVAHLVRARDAQAEDDLPARLMSMAWAFRGWALEHRHEYGLLFANPLNSERLHDPATVGGCTHEAGKRFGAVFAEVFAAMWHTGVIRPPDLSGISPELLRQLDEADEPMAGLPLEVRYLYVRSWARLYGTVTLEAFGHLHWAMADTSTLFESMLADCAAELGLPAPPV